MKEQTSPNERQRFYQLHGQGQTYAQLAQTFGVSKECVRYWCRRLREGKDPHTHYAHRSTSPLQGFDPRLRYHLLRFRLKHPCWGPNRLRFHLAKVPSLRGLRLPSEASIGRYLYQWPRFRRRPAAKPGPERLHPPTTVHQRWQIDFKVGIDLQQGECVNLYTVRDPFGEACLGAYLIPAGYKERRREKRVTEAQVRSVLRQCFARWHTLPDEVQTDGESCLVPVTADRFPSTFTLWLKGLGVEHLVIHRVTQNAEVERCHRTLNDYAIVGNEACSLEALQCRLQQAVDELLSELPSRAEGCAGKPPLQAHPELLQPRRWFQPEQELAHFDLHRVDAYLAGLAWQRKVGKNGQVKLGLGGRRYTVGARYRCQEVGIRFDPDDRTFVFSPAKQSDQELRRLPAKGLDVADLTGLAPWPLGLGHQQLPLPLSFPQEVTC